MIVRGLYSMKQAGRIWSQVVNKNMAFWGFQHLACESCIFYCITDYGTVIVVLHVNNFLSIASSKDENEWFKAQMCQAWIISDLGLPCFMVGIAIE